MQLAALLKDLYYGFHLARGIIHGLPFANRRGALRKCRNGQQ
jgi:hypothetical protein